MSREYFGGSDIDSGVAWYDVIDEEGEEPPHCHFCSEALPEGEGVEVPKEGLSCRACANEYAAEEARIAAEAGR